MRSSKHYFIIYENSIIGRFANMKIGFLMWFNVAEFGEKERERGGEREREGG